MAVQKSKVTRSRRGQRRSHDSLKASTLSIDPVSGEKHARHQMTKDGFLSNKNGYTKDFNSSNITSPETQYFMHKYRLSHDAIAVGYNTLKDDKPKLNCRLNGIDKRNYKFIISRPRKNDTL